VVLGGGPREMRLTLVMSFKYATFDEHGIVYYDEADLKGLGFNWSC
jgi:hypothetical protein